ncbi:hypothetical protein RRG08_052281 [Elysia crispata]|uniref:Uncharacterized protein n=1 Tax=Elysia crispata TaxID=231223 RepID=A0AAE0ZYR2_9GAST|nr:hypothetical protein RRG08_052281 [Elysia crispata]
MEFQATPTHVGGQRHFARRSQDNPGSFPRPTPTSRRQTPAILMAGGPVSDRRWRCIASLRQTLLKEKNPPMPSMPGSL